MEYIIQSTGIHVSRSFIVDPEQPSLLLLLKSNYYINSKTECQLWASLSGVCRMPLMFANWAVFSL